jgi:hypothetical protein
MAIFQGGVIRFDCFIFFKNRNTLPLSISLPKHHINLYLNVAKVGGLQSQGVKGDTVVGYREPLTTQDMKSSGFPGGETTWQNRPHPLNSPNGVSSKWCFFYDIGYNNEPLASLCHVVYATLRLIRICTLAVAHFF